MKRVFTALILMCALVCFGSTVGRAQTGQLSDLDALRYIASHPDLIAAFGTDAAKGRAHYEQWGIKEGRKITFEPLNYTASHADLIGAFGVDETKSVKHYIQFGFKEGRQTTFNALRYVASHPDLIDAFGADGAKGARHYIEFGFKEGRKATFDPLRYIASHRDLIAAFGGDEAKATMHYIQFGYKEKRQSTFSDLDALNYIASYGDLISAFATDVMSGIRHYVSSGYSEGRRILFDGLAYIASYRDLISVFGTDAISGAKHYINFGYKEGRRIIFDAVGYLQRYSDLKSAFGDNTIAATQHYILFGASEGRSSPVLKASPSGPFATSDLRIAFTPFTYQFDLPSGKTSVTYQMGGFRRTSEFSSTTTYRVMDYGFFDIVAKGLHAGCSIAECGEEYADPGPWGPTSTSLATDINKDGFEDFYLFDFLIGERGPQPNPLIHAFLNDGEGHFALSTESIFGSNNVCSAQGGIGPKAIPAKSRESECGYTTGPLRHALLADFNNDGMVDIYAYFVLYLSENGRLQNKTLTHLPEYFRQPYMAAVFTHDHYAADVDSDGDIDIFIPTIQTTEPGWFGDGTKVSGCSTCVATMPWSVLINDGAGRFSLNQKLPILGVGLDHPLLVDYKPLATMSRGILWGGEKEKLWVTAAGIADFDKDGHGDLVVGWYNPRATGVWNLGENSAGVVYFNDGKNDWTKRAPAILPASPYGKNGNGNDAAILDFNDDGWPDIVLASTKFQPYYQGRYLQFLENNRSGGFTDVTRSRNVSFARYADGAGSARFNGEGLLTVRDYDGDGDVDIIDSTAFTYVLLNDGRGIFSLLEHFLIPEVDGSNWTAHPVNINKSGKLDFVGSRLKCVGDTCVDSHYQLLN
jgi:hypothetical protein